MAVWTNAIVVGVGAGICRIRATSTGWYHEVGTSPWSITQRSGDSVMKMIVANRMRATASSRRTGIGSYQ